MQPKVPETRTITVEALAAGHGVTPDVVWLALGLLTWDGRATADAAEACHSGAAVTTRAQSHR